MKLKKLSVALILVGLVLLDAGIILQGILSVSQHYLLTADAASGRTYFARVLAEGVYFHASPDEGEKVFQIEPTYFVELTANENETFYAARYLDQNGYVKKNEVSPVSGNPQTPFVQGRYATVVGGGDSVYLRTRPTRVSTWEYKIPDGETNVLYYGKSLGQEVMPGNSNWVFVKYFSDNTTVCTGYVYSQFCSFLAPVVPNGEVMQPLTTTLFEDSTGTQTGERVQFGNMPLYLQILIVAGVSIPCLLVIYLLFKPTRMAAQAFEGSAITADAGSRRKIRQPRRDYYEMDD